MINISADDAPLYDSGLAAGSVPQPLVKTFTPDEAIEMEINRPPVTAAPPVQKPSMVESPSNGLVTPMTLIPQKTVIQPDLAAAPEVPPVVVNMDLLQKAYDPDTAAKIVTSLQEDEPMPRAVTEKLVRENIVREASQEESSPAKDEVVLPTNPVVEGQQKKAIAKPKKRKRGFFDKVVDYIYKSIYA